MNTPDSHDEALKLRRGCSFITPASPPPRPYMSQYLLSSKMNYNSQRKRSKFGWIHVLHSKEVTFSVMLSIVLNSAAACRGTNGGVSFVSMPLGMRQQVRDTVWTAILCRAPLCTWSAALKCRLRVKAIWKECRSIKNVLNAELLWQEHHLSVTGRSFRGDSFDVALSVEDKISG